jgi:hypothetical protein
MKKTSLFTLLGLTFLITTGAVFGEESEQAKLAKQAQNPIASLISLPIQNNTNFGIGPDDETQNITNIQPVWPFKLGNNLNLITRTIVPLISQPNFYTGGQGRKFGLGDISFTAFFSPSKLSKLTWGVGPVLVIPTATDDTLGTGEWSGGVSVVGLVMPGKWVIGMLLSNVWDLTGSQNVNFFTWQYFVNYNIAKGWYLTSAPIMTANWLAPSGDQWTVPVGGGVGKIFKIGKQNMNAQAQAFYNVVKPEFGPDWQLRLQLQFLFPK